MEDAVIPRKTQVCTLQLLKAGVKIDSKTVHIDPLILLTRLAGLIQRYGKVEENFKYEFIPEQTTLFRNGMMRKSGKSVLRNYLLNKYPSFDCLSSRFVVIDGCALLHKVKWFYGSSFADIIDSYIQYIQNRFSKYESVIIIFDGYKQQLSIKSSEHKRRTSQVTAADVVLTRDMTLTTTCEIFLHNTRNKDQFIKALLVQLKEPGFLTYQSEGDADTFIVKRALQEATTLQSMLWLKILTYWSSLSITGTTRKNDVFFNTEKRQKLTKVNKWWNIVCFKGGNASD